MSQLPCMYSQWPDKAPPAHTVWQQGRLLEYLSTLVALSLLCRSFSFLKVLPAEMACPVCTGVPAALSALWRGHRPGAPPSRRGPPPHVQRAPLFPAAAGVLPPAAQRGFPHVHRRGVPSAQRGIPPPHRHQHLHEHRWRQPMTHQDGRCSAARQH